MKKKGNLSFTVMFALVIVCCGAAVLSVASASKYNAKSEYKRTEDRYIAESGVDTAVGLFLNYLSNRDLVLAYQRNENGGYEVEERYVPYLLDEIKTSDTSDTVPIRIIENESKDYLAASGYLDYITDGTIEFSVNTFGDKDRFKLSRMCVEHNFLISDAAENTADRKSRLNPIYLTVKTKYRGGEVLANIKIVNLYAVRKPFSELGGSIGSVSACIDTENAEVVYENYQNYRGN